MRDHHESLIEVALDSSSSDDDGSDLLIDAQIM
jgi:hypothetical protein